MNKTFLRSAFALPLLLAASGVQANETDPTELPATANTESADIAVVGLRPDAHGPAGTMADHVHQRGDLMFGLMWMHESYGGASRQGTKALTEAQVAAAGYAVRDRAMTMDMAMLHVMWAPNDRVTLMVVPSWMRMAMTMEGLPQPAGSALASGHGLMPGQVMAHTTAGIGDTQLGALIALSRRPALSAHAGLIVSAPTGSVSRRNASGSFVHYMMQGGSGTWDLNPTFTLRGSAAQFGWGVQAGYLFRAQKVNSSGYRLGDRFSATGWLSRPLGTRLSLSARLGYSDEGPIRGHYNAAHNHAAPPDRQANYGGQKLDGALGLNLMLGDRLRLGGELSVPLYQRLGGIQLPRQFATSVSVSSTF